MINQDAFDLVCNNMRETPTNSKKTFAKYMLGVDLGGFAQLLMEAWSKADGDNQERLAIAFPQIAYAMLNYSALPEKKQKKYLESLLK